ncbi:hypothetical protein [Streptomyces sp. NBC_01669]|uniref:hypothetical protein n=1 Tax=Streptomyces sp. NBC_01669 TaxID=2975909 RepID=UPI0022502133|nr:hypothetical protein [Streptomyces sp. NBC_01669]MCX4533127.1 hypothetical protein [Streptomyces sp. NBC_01669]
MDAEGHVMADEQDAWLDRDAAERLLRGEPVDPGEGHARADAERLAAALGAAARSARPAAGELPGEAAALAAFRTARRAGTRAMAPADVRSAGHATKDSGPKTLGPVRIGPAASQGGRTRAPRWSRPVRFGLAASLAGCALGGVAVAAGAGVLPGPFGKHANPLPASSVSASAFPEELGSGDASGRTTAPPSGSPDVNTSPDSSGGTHQGKDDRDGTSGKAGTPDGSGARNGGSVGPRSPDATDSKGTPGGGQDDTSGVWFARTLKACRDYRDGKLDGARRRRLEKLADGAANLDRFCQQIFDKAGDEGDQDQGNDADEQNGADADAAPRADGSANALQSLWFAPGTPAPSAPASPTGVASPTATAPAVPANG